MAPWVSETSTQRPRPSRASPRGGLLNTLHAASCASPSPLGAPLLHPSATFAYQPHPARCPPPPSDAAMAITMDTSISTGRRPPRWLSPRPRQPLQRQSMSASHHLPPPHGDDCATPSSNRLRTAQGRRVVEVLLKLSSPAERRQESGTRRWKRMMSTGEVVLAPSRRHPRRRYPLRTPHNPPLRLMCARGAAKWRDSFTRPSFCHPE